MFLDKKDMAPDLNVSHGKMSDFVSFPLFGFNSVKKTEKFQFRKSLKYFKIF